MPRRHCFPGFCCLGTPLVLQENACDGTAKLAEDFATQTTSASADGVSRSLLTVGIWGCFFFFSSFFLFVTSKYF